jgi:ribosomal-protein-alanine N-acetyltransferase
VTAPTLTTARLVLRPWRDADRDALAALNADPEVMRYLVGPLSRVESDAMFDRLVGHFATHGFGLWAVEVPGVAACVGFVGLMVPSFTAHFTPCVEVGWRLARGAWGHGWASEGAHAACRFGFAQLGLAEIVALTVPANTRSRAVMERLGMTRDPADDFDHPRVAPGHPLLRHVLYRLRPDGLRDPAPRGDGSDAASSTSAANAGR